MDMQYTAVIFDLDGTLLNTLEDIAEASNQALATCGLPPFPVDRYRDFVGQGVRRLCERIIPAGDNQQRLMEKCLVEFRRAYSANWNVRTRPYDGTDELLEGLASRDVRMAVLSNKPHDFVRKSVEEYFPKVPFQAVLGEGNGIAPKPDPTGAQQIMEQFGLPPHEFLYLGDTPTDMATAIAAGALPVGASWGFRPTKELEAAGARHIIGQPQELLDIVDAEA